MKEKVINKYKTLKKLQEENERLQQNNYDMQREMAMCWQRIDKAVEVIKTKYPVLCRSEADFKEELLNILCGE